MPNRRYMFAFNDAHGFHCERHICNEYQAIKYARLMVLGYNNWDWCRVYDWHGTLVYEIG